MVSIHSEKQEVKLINGGVFRTTLKTMTMKQLLLAIMLVFTANICSAQTNHMKFKGIPMEGTLQSFTAKLKDKGFTSLGIQDGVSLLTGEFAGYKNCSIYAIADNSGMICKASVTFPDMDKWGELEECYNSYKLMLTEKYGDPKKCEESFSYAHTPDDGQKIRCVKMDSYKYYSLFTTELGEIKLEISHEGISRCYVRLSYFDNANQEKLKQQIMDDL